VGAGAGGGEGTGQREHNHTLAAENVLGGAVLPAEGVGTFHGFVAHTGFEDNAGNALDNGHGILLNCSVENVENGRTENGRTENGRTENGRTENK
jgi:hypothetical protein